MSNLKSAVVFVAAVGLVWSGAASAAPLAAGKPAGVKDAQMDGGPVLVWIGLAAVAAAGIAAAAASGSSPSAFNTVAASTSTTS